MRSPQLQCVAVVPSFILFSLMSAGQEPVAILTPLHYTAYLGEPAVRFHCSATNASDTGWRINGRPIGNNIADLNARGISVETDNSLLESNLTISSVVSNNNTHILCVAHHLVEFRYVPTAEATFQVQGTLERCRGLQIIPLGTYHQRLTWNPPPTLNITAVEPDISGYILCDNIRSECTHTDMRKSSDSHDLLQYTFPNLRAHINFTVMALNIVGGSASTSIVYEPCEYPEGAPEEFADQALSAVVSFYSNTTSVSLEMVSQRRCFDVYVVHIEPVELETGSVGSELHELIESDPIIPSVTVSGEDRVRLTLKVITNSTLSTNMFYCATLITITDTMEAGKVLFSTYDVQGAEIYDGIGTISIWCLFAPGSQAKGCHVEIGKTAIRINVPRLSGDPPLQTAEQAVIDITPGSYEVLIFDWERDGSFSSTPSYVDHVNVTGPDILTSSMPPMIGTMFPISNQPVQPSQDVNITGIAAGVGSAAAVLLVAITCTILVIGIAVFESRKPKVYTISV